MHNLAHVSGCLLRRQMHREAEQRISSLVEQPRADLDPVFKESMQVSFTTHCKAPMYFAIKISAPSGKHESPGHLSYSLNS